MECKHYAEFEGVCCNGDCPLKAEFIDNQTTCKVCKYREGDELKTFSEKEFRENVARIIV